MILLSLASKQIWPHVLTFAHLMPECDDRLPRRYTGPLKILNPVSFILQLCKSP